MKDNKIVGKNFKDELKKIHKSKFVSTDPEVKKKFGVFKTHEIFKYEDKQHFKGLYTFDNKQLEEFSLPEEKKEKERQAQLIFEKNEKKKKALLEQKQRELEKEDEEKKDKEAIQDNMEGIEEDEEKNKELIEVCLKIFDPNRQREENFEQEIELYEKKGSKTELRYKEIDSGEKAVQFFAMYGNTTPIKFIFCRKKQQKNKFINRPYELEKIEAKQAVGDYFIISPTGITHVYDPQGEIKPGAVNVPRGKTIAEFYTLSDWMYQSSLFDILTRINYFKDYRSFKVLTLWVNYHRFKKFTQTRTKLSQRLFLTKPAFVNTLIQSNGELAEIDKIVMQEIYVSGRSWSSGDMGDFEDAQKKKIDTAKADFRRIIQITFETLHKLYEKVKKTLKENKEIDEEQNSKTLQELKNKSMSTLKQENKLRKKLILMAEKDKQLFEPFVKMIDLMVIELIYKLNKKTLKDIYIELKKLRHDSNYNGIFTLALRFKEANVDLVPTESMLLDKFSNLFKMIIDCFIEIPRIISFTKRDIDQIVSTETNDAEKNLARFNEMVEESIKNNLKKILDQSIYYIKYTNRIYEKMSADFTVSFESIKASLQKLKKIQLENELYANQKKILLDKGEWDLDGEEGSKEVSIYSLKNKREELQRENSENIGGLLSLNVKPERVINVDVTVVKNELSEFVKKITGKIDDLIKNMYKALVHEIQIDSDKGDKIFKTTIGTKIKVLSDQRKLLKGYQENLNRLKSNCEKYEDLYKMVTNFKINMSTSELGIPEKIKRSYERQSEEFNKYLNQLIQAKNTQNQNLAENINTNKTIIKTLNEQINSDIFVEPEANREEVKAKLELISQEIKESKEKTLEYKDYIDTLEMEIEGNTKGDLDKLEENFKNRNKLWNALIDFERESEEWMGMTLEEIRSINIDEKYAMYNKIGNEMTKNYSDSISNDKVCEWYLSKLTKVGNYLPTISALSSSSMLERHWIEVFKIISISWTGMDILKSYTLKNLIEDHSIHGHADKIDTISAAAIAQERIQKDIDKIESDWKNCNFEIIPHNNSKDKFIIKSVEEIMKLLEEHTQLVQSAMNSRYVSDIRKQVQQWEDDLNLINRVIEEWLQVQRQWIYLENIFSAEDIKKQIPDAQAKFSKVNKGFKDLMFRTFQKPSVLEGCKKEGLLESLVRFNKELDIIQKSLEDYLQTKRAAFPRFYFLSNDELLKILSQTRNPRAVQDYLNKCFDGIKNITFESETSNEITHMISPENEEVKLSKSLYAHEVIESWLCDLEEIMFLSVYDECKRALEDYPEYGEPRKDWIWAGYPCQAVITIDQVQWGKYTEIKFQEIQTGKNKMALKEYYSFLEKQIFELAELVQTKCPDLQKSLVERLIIINVHAREVVKSLIEQNVMDKSNFEWSKQLKFFWENDIARQEVVIRQTNSRFLYGYEYLGNPERMVITPLTDKCYITLTSALHLNYGGAPAGPAGTGKTETTKDLAKAMAIKVNVFNCSDQLDFQMMGRMFCGLAECGAWACFDEFNRIDVEVLSVIAQQILTIQNGIRDKKWELLFDGKNIKLKPRFGVFITMNPGYAGRSELPDNLKSLFRPVAMMIPDYALVSEVTLFSKGFKEAKELSIKMFQLFKLSSEQLSKQKHYDFGLRGIKSILSRAGYLKGKFQGESENKVLIRAMRDSNLPKFLDDDIELFQDIISDLFPKVKVEESENLIFKEKVKEILLKENLQVVKRLVEKINQLLDTMMVRLGNMVVGYTGTGKSTTHTILAKTLTELGKNKELSDPWYCKVIQSILNPKSVTKNELYMSKDFVTQTWEDGIVAKIMRNAEEEEKEEKIPVRKWLCFDGPVDALWIEDMNTVLDDSRKLCLPDGSNIRIPKMMNLIFEVNDLQVASPATVSRCGMIYMEPTYVGYVPIIDSWVLTYTNKLNKIFSEDISYKNFGQAAKEYVMQVNESANRLKTFTREALPLIRRSYKEMIPSVDVNLVQTFLNLFSCFFNPDEIKVSSDKFKENIRLYFVFCLIWSFGANLEDNSRKEFSNYIKKKSKEFGVNFDKSDVYDLLVKDEDSTFGNWNDRLREKGFSYQSGASFFNILVPTTDTIKYQYLMQYIVKYNLNSLFIGETGVGKSVIIVDFLKNLTAVSETEQNIYQFKSSNFSAKTTSKNVYDTLKTAFNKGGDFKPSTGKKFVYFIDDLNLPQLDEYGSQQPIEFLRQLIDLKTFYDEKKSKKIIKDVIFMAACAPPSGGRNPVTPRLFRHFHMIWMTELSEDSMKHIFKSILNGWLDLGTDKDKIVKLKEETGSIIDAATYIYDKIRKEKLPTPSKSHYTFNLRDLSKVVQGILQMKYEHIDDKIMLIKLWSHETSRQFRDRLLGEDIQWFDSLINSTYDTKFNQKDLQITINDLIFTDIHEKDYKLVSDYNILYKKIVDSCDRYNTFNKYGQMMLVFFSDAVNHFCRISRILKQKRGNALLVGMGGSGRQSLTKLVAYVINCQMNNLQMTKGYNTELFWKDLGRILNRAGTSEYSQIFVFSDTQIIFESFLEDINNILNNGEVPNLFKEEEIVQIFNTLKDQAKKEEGIPENKDSVYQYFVSKVRDNLRIVLAFSPVGEGFRNRCRQFPSIINCCTIDWFNPWPNEALVSVAEKYFRANPILQENEELISKLCRIFVKIQSKATDLSDRFFKELRRAYYITPTSYLEFLKLFDEIYREKINIIPTSIENYKQGLKKLEEAKNIVNNLQVNLKELKPQLDAKQNEITILIANLEVQSKVVNEEKLKIQGDKDKAEIDRDSIKKIKDECDEELKLVKPQLDEAAEALSKLSPDDINNMRKLPKPPERIVNLGKCICYIYEQKTLDWETTQKLLANSDFIENCKDTNLMIKKLNNPMRLKELAKLFEIIASYDYVKVSMVAVGLKLWVGAMLTYVEKWRFVNPKMQSLEKAAAELQIVEKNLEEKSRYLKQKEDEVAKLTKEYKEANDFLDDLKKRKENIEIQLKRAGRLVDGMKNEGMKWKENIFLLEKDAKNLNAYLILAAAIVSFSGPYTIEYRKEFLRDVKNFISEEGIYLEESKEFSLANMFSDPLTIRDWNYAGLPADDLSVDNAIITIRTKRWPLLIDPQMQANKWIKNYFKKDLRNYKVSDKALFNRLKDCISNGYQVLIENVEQTLDSALEPILAKNLLKIGNNYQINLGDKPIAYIPTFRLFMTSKLSNPHYLPEISIKVTLINFTVAIKGLEDQLLVEVVKHESPELEKIKDQLIFQINEDTKTVKEIENDILIRVRDAGDDILETDTLVKKLEESKIKSEQTKEKLIKAEETASEINKKRKKYRPIAVRGSVIYFVIASLSGIDSMYNYSLEYFLKLFNQILEKPTELLKEDIDKRVSHLIDDVTLSFYEKISRGLFEKDKIVYSFLMLVNILINDDVIDIKQWNFFLRGSAIPPEILKFDLTWIDLPTYKKFISLTECSRGFYELEESLKNPNDIPLWQEYLKSDFPLTVKLPPVAEKLGDFDKLLMLKVIREEKLIFGVKNYIEKNLGKNFLLSPPFSVATAVGDSLKSTPLIFVLSPGANPVIFLSEYAKEKSITIKKLSLGQGQGELAKQYILHARKFGEWVCLENCHLSISWMPKLEEILEDTVDSEVNTNFRLWLTSMPTRHFPDSILQSGIKITNEPPKGIKQNLRGIFLNIKDSFEGSKKPFEFKKLLFGLAFFHAIILERRKFGPLGWNIPYEWMNSDFETSKLHLKMYVEESQEIPLKILRYLVGDINYGGRVTDDKDAKLISAILSKYFNELIFDDAYKFSESNIYYAPKMGSIENVFEYLETLPLDDDPIVFGLHQNANITLQAKNVKEFLEPLISIQPRSSSSGSFRKPDDIVLEICIELEKKLKGCRDLDRTNPHKPSIYDDPNVLKKSSLGNFLLQEVEKFNTLIYLMRSTLKNLQLAVNGKIMMSPVMEKVYNSFLDGLVPKLFEDVSYLCLKPLGSWIDDLVKRIEFMAGWLLDAKPKSYWISALFFPQGFNTAVLQTYARKTSLPIDKLILRTNVTRFSQDGEIDVPDEGLNIHGLYLQGASWEWEENRLKEPDYGELWHLMPVIWFEPIRLDELKKFGFCEVPLYKTSKRAGELSTTGHSTNFVMYFFLKCDEDPDHWIRRGTALLTQLDN